MDDREKARLRLTRGVLRSLRTRDSRAAFPPPRDGGDVAILVAFRDETLESVLERIALLGGHATVVVAPGDLKEWPAVKTRIAIDPNIRVRGTGTYAGFEDADGPLAVGDVVEVFEPESDLVGKGSVTDVDAERELVYLSVEWASLRP